MPTRMVATHRRYTKQQKRAYRQRLKRREVNAAFERLANLQRRYEEVAGRPFSLLTPPAPRRTLDEILATGANEVPFAEQSTPLQHYGRVEPNHLYQHNHHHGDSS